jgi:hypothetical protein
MKQLHGVDELDDDALHDAFATVRLPPDRFHHREHVRVAFVYLARAGDLASAAVEFRAALRRFAAAHGIPQLFHETLTWAYLVLIHERMNAGSYATSLELIAANPDLLDHRGGALARYYDVRAVTTSPLARSCFVLPGDPRL